MIAIVNTGGANLSSIQDALSRLGHESVITLDQSVLNQATHLILPGVGHAKFAMERLKQSELDVYIKAQTKPVLGICLGMQLMYEHSEEGYVKTLGLVSGQVSLMKADESFKVPHMGWCQLKILNPSRLLEGLTRQNYFYFVHSFQASKNSEATRAIANYDDKYIPAVIECKNFYGTQFHPEKSGSAGAKILSNFINIK